MSSVAVIEKYPQNKRSSIAIRPYVDTNIDNMGLQKYNLSLFDGTFHEEPLSCIEINGIKRFITGLNEFAPEIKELSFEEQEAKIKQIRTVVAQLEKELAANVLDINDESFWNKVKLLRPDNEAFWGEIKIRCGNDPLYPEPDKDPYDLIKLYAIEAGGFSIVAKSFEEARKMAKTPKFYLDKLEETVAVQTEVKKLRNKALVELQKLFDKNQNKLFYVAKILDINSAQYKKTTPNDIIYDNMDKYINGELSDKDKRKCPQRFLDVCNLDMETLKIKAIVKDSGSSYYKVIANKADGFIYHMQSGAILGRTQNDVVEYLKNPLNEEILMDLTKKVEKYWNM
jgi:uncharacterized coiled-coil protein SlyX